MPSMGFMFMTFESRGENRGSRIKSRGSRIPIRGFDFVGFKSREENRGCRIKKRDSRMPIIGIVFMNFESRGRNRGCKTDSRVLVVITWIPKKERVSNLSLIRYADFKCRITTCTTRLLLQGLSRL